MHNSDISRYLKAFRSHSCEPPRGYVWAAKREIIGFQEFSQFEPWYFCAMEEIEPLHQRWEGFKAEFNFIPFARRQDCDELACFKLKGADFVGISVIHYGLGPPLSWKIHEEYKTFWAWFCGIVKDVERWYESPDNAEK
jgi:hypothetical protein